MATPLPVLQRSAAELLASCVIDLFPGALLSDGGATEYGFYYDIIAEQPIDDYALPLLEEKMRGVAKAGIEIRTLDMMRENAASFMKHRGQPIRAESVLDHSYNIVQLIQFGSYTNVCEAPFAATTGELEFTKLIRVETFLRTFSDEDEVTVKRIIGVVASDKQSLKQQIKALTAGAKQDHRKYSGERGLFHPLPDLSDFSVVLGSNGTLLKDLLIDWWKKERRKEGFSLITTPVLNKGAFFEGKEIASGHDLITDCQIGGEFYALPEGKAVAHAVYFHSMGLSINDLPLRIAEISPLVASGDTPGLWGAFTAQLTSGDYAHRFCTAEQLEEEVISSLQFIAKFTKLFGFEYRWYFTNQAKTTGARQGLWTKAVRAFESAFEKCGLTYCSDEINEAAGGPLAVAMLIDRYGREWKGPKISIDLGLAERLSIRYNGPGNEKRVPYLVSCTVFGAIERFMALLLEHHGGNLPFWLAPEQIRVLSVTNAFDAYAIKTAEALEKAGYRANADCRNTTIGKKIGSADKECVPNVVIVGENEENEGLITLRFAGGDGRQQTMTLNALLERLNEAELSPAQSPDRRKAKHNDGKSA